MNLPIDQVREAILFLIALILSISVHEFGHALVATKLGDPLPKSQGRLTLAPTRHIDPIGTIVFPLIMFFTHVPLIGWGRPVETNPLMYTRRVSRSTGQMLVALAGPGMNLAMALAVSLLVVIGGQLGLISSGMAIGLLEHLIFLNLFLMFFNLLPIPPLDGGAVLAWALPRSLQPVVDFLARWGFLILLAIALTPLLSYVMYPVTVLSRTWGLILLGVSGL